MLEALQTLDGSILLWIQEFVRNDLLDAFFSFYTRLSDHGELWIGLCIIALCSRKTRKAGALGLVALLLGHVVTSEILKNLIQRPRPFFDVAGLATVIEPPDSTSFPSGHSCASFAAAGTLIAVLHRKHDWPKWGSVVLAVMAALMALSRIYVGVHYPTDIIAGSLVGLLCSAVVVRYLGPAYDRWAERVRWN